MRWCIVKAEDWSWLILLGFTVDAHTLQQTSEKAAYTCTQRRAHTTEQHINKLSCTHSDNTHHSQCDSAVSYSQLRGNRARSAELKNACQVYFCLRLALACVTNGASCSDLLLPHFLVPLSTLEYNGKNKNINNLQVLQHAYRPSQELCTNSKPATTVNTNYLSCFDWELALHIIMANDYFRTPCKMGEALWTNKPTICAA